MLGFGFQAWLLGLKPMGFGFRPPHVKPLQGANRMNALPYPFGSITESNLQNQVVGIVCESRINALPCPFGSITESKYHQVVGMVCETVNPE